MSIENRTEYALCISLDQVGPLYYAIVKPRDTFYRNTGAVHFTIKAYIWDGHNELTDWSCAIPIITVAGGFVVGAATGGLGALGLLLGTAGLATSGAFAGGTFAGLATSELAIAGATLGGGITFGTVSAAVVPAIKDAMENTKVSSAGWWAGHHHKLKIVGGPIPVVRKGVLDEIQPRAFAIENR